jgi:type II secretory pathway pseudopilin PulG
MKQNVKKGMRKGITLIEIILAIVLIAIILGITIPKLMSNSAKAEIKQVVASDLKSIVSAAKDWRKSSATAAGSFDSIKPSAIASRLPSNMMVDTTDKVILSAGLLTGSQTSQNLRDTGIQYNVGWNLQKITLAAVNTGTPVVKTGRFSIVVDIRNGVNELGWENQLVVYAQDVINDTIAEMIEEGETLSTYVSNASAVTLDGITYDCSNANILCFDSLELN